MSKLEGGGDPIDLRPPSSVRVTIISSRRLGLNCLRNLFSSLHMEDCSIKRRRSCNSYFCTKIVRSNERLCIISESLSLYTVSCFSNLEHRLP